jgi:hypothetical protein
MDPDGPHFSRERVNILWVWGANDRQRVHPLLSPSRAEGEIIFLDCIPRVASSRTPPYPGLTSSCPAGAAFVRALRLGWVLRVIYIRLRNAQQPGGRHNVLMLPICRHGARSSRERNWEDVQRKFSGENQPWMNGYGPGWTTLFT